MIPIHVISLPHAHHRRTRMTAQLESLGLPFSFYDAIEGSKLDQHLQDHAYDLAGRLRRYGKPLTAGEVGCLLSHRAVIEKIAQGPDDMAMVMDDDVIIDPQFTNALNALAQSDKNTWHVVRFLAEDKISKVHQRRVQILNDGFELRRILKLSCGAYAYAMTKAGAQKILPRLAQTPYPVDMVMARAWEGKMNNFVLRPCPLRHDDNIASSIGSQRFKKPTRQPSWTYPLTRALFKLSEACNKHAYYWGEKI